MISYDFTMILQGFYNETMTSYDLLGLLRISKDLQGPHMNYMISYDFNMILQLLYKETITSYDILRHPRTS